MMLTKRLLDAMEEALTARLAGAIEDALDQRDYEDALRWVRIQMAGRKRHKKHERTLSKLRVQRDAAAVRGNYVEARRLNDIIHRERNALVAEPLRAIINEFSEGK